MIVSPLAGAFVPCISIYPDVSVPVVEPVYANVDSLPSSAFVSSVQTLFGSVAATSEPSK